MQNIKELRDSLTENYELLKNQKMSIKLAKELANTSGKVLTSLRVELEYDKMTDTTPNIEFLNYKK